MCRHELAHHDEPAPALCYRRPGHRPRAERECGRPEYAAAGERADPGIADEFRRSTRRVLPAIATRDHDDFGQAAARLGRSTARGTLTNRAASTARQPAHSSIHWRAPRSSPGPAELVAANRLRTTTADTIRRPVTRVCWHSMRPMSTERRVDGPGHRCVATIPAKRRRRSVPSPELTTMLAAASAVAVSRENMV